MAVTFTTTGAPATTEVKEAPKRYPHSSDHLDKTRLLGSVAITNIAVEPLVPSPHLKVNTVAYTGQRV